MKIEKSTFAEKVFLLGFCGFLILVMAVTVIRPKETYSYYENRSLAAFPQVTSEALLTGQWGSDVDKYLADHCAMRNSMLNLSTILDLYILRQPLVNDVVVAGDCLLPEIPAWMENTSYIQGDVAAITENLKSLDTLVESYGGQYYYAAVPCQYAFFPDQYPWYMNNRKQYTEQMLSSLSASLEEAGVNFIDTGKVYAKHGWAEHLSSKIDNHYGIEGAYLTYLEIMERINADSGLDLEILTEGEYRIRYLPNPYLGSRNRKLMGLWPSDEHMGILIPEIEVPFTRKDNGVEVAPTVYAMPATDTEDVLYSLYMNGDIALTEIDTGREELPTILIYGDSFSNAAECILYYGFDKMYSIDMRHYTSSTLGEFIAQHQPDFVVCIRDYEALLTTTQNGCGAAG